MNVLIFVVTMILLLATLSYESMSNFLNMSLTRKQWQEFMQKDERGEQYVDALKLYDVTTVKEGKQDPRKRVQSTALINFSLIVDPQKQQQQPQLTQSLIEIAKNLITQMYQNDIFFQELQVENPGFLDRIFEVLRNPIDASGQPLKVKSSAELSYIYWQDHKLHKAFNTMLMESYSPQIVVKQQPSILQQDQPRGGEIIIEEDPEAPNPDDHRDPPGYKSLRGFITFDPARYKIRVYRAPREVLLAIYNNPEVVEEIVQSSRRLYSDVQRGKTFEEATEEFKNQFSSSAPPAYSELLDFTVNKTSPDSYR